MGSRETTELWTNCCTVLHVGNLLKEFVGPMELNCGHWQVDVKDHGSGDITSSRCQIVGPTGKPNKVNLSSPTNMRIANMQDGIKGCVFAFLSISVCTEAWIDGFMHVCMSLSLFVAAFAATIRSIRQSQ